MISEILYTNKFDNKIAVTNEKGKYTYGDIKKLVFAEMTEIKNLKENVVITGGDNFAFIMQFFASLFCNKNLFLITEKTRLNSLNADYDVLDGYPENIADEKIIFPQIDINKPAINFFTSGSAGIPKNIRKSLFNLIKEGEDAGKELGLKGKELSVASTTVMCHLFGLTFHLMTPICNGLTINTDSISYPENFDKEKTILVSTPTFLTAVPKFDLSFKVMPEYILSAGSKLDDKVFEYFEKQTNVIEIYGSTETGIIAHKEKHNNDLKLFDNVQITQAENHTEISSDYMFEDKISINDKVVLNNRFLQKIRRTDRLFKINEKRVSADELEAKLNKHQFVSKSYITKNDEKLVCFCALTRDGQEFLLKNNIAALTKTLKTFLLQNFEIIPQKWKYSDEIPMTTEGKINKTLIEHIFNVNLSLPLIFGRTLAENSIEYNLLFYKECNFFKGHFPSFPIVPGVAQLFLAKEFANAHFHLNIRQGQWKRIKFSNIIQPDSIIKLRLEKTEKHVSFEYCSETKKCASGIFLCENIFKGEV
ncbi:MAG: AMP-binding protein [Candidatus Gastranaerophilales bacterium]|nr:AMP-binding protein [Candidatus Gastranaerophilales bacterium]